MNTGTLDMTTGPLFPKIVKMAIPMVIAGILQLLFSTADLIVIGRFAGSDSQAAVGATGSLNLLLINLVLGVSVGVNVVMSQAIGAKNHEKCERVVHTSMLLALVAGMIFGATGCAITRPALVLMNTDPAVIGKATLYLEIIFAGTVANVVYNFGAALLRAKGDTVRPLIYLTIAGVLNVALNVLCVVVLKMDVAGVAIPTVASQLLSAVLVVIALLREKGECKLTFRKLRFHRQEFVEVLKIGVPSGVYGSMFSVANVTIQAQVNSFGADFMAGASVSTSLEAFTYTAMSSVATSVSVVAGQNYGAGKKKRIVTAMWENALLVMITFAIVGVPTMIFARPLASLYNSDPVVVDYALIRLFMILPIYFVAVLAEIFVNALRGIGHSTAPTVAVIGCVCVFRVIWVNTVFVWFRSVKVLFACYPASYVLELGILIVMFAVIFRKVPSEITEKTDSATTPSVETDASSAVLDEAAATADRFTEADSDFLIVQASDSDKTSGDILNEADYGRQ